MLEDQVWEAVEPSLYGVTRAQFYHSIEGWTLTPHLQDGVQVGIVMTRGDELHFVTHGQQWSLRRGEIRRYIEPILASHGRVRTQSLVDDVRQQRFNCLMGFVETGRNEFFVEYELTELFPKRGKTCRQ